MRASTFRSTDEFVLNNFQWTYFVLHCFNNVHMRASERLSLCFYWVDQRCLFWRRHAHLGFLNIRFEGCIPLTGLPHVVNTKANLQQWVTGFNTSSRWIQLHVYSTIKWKLWINYDVQVVIAVFVARHLLQYPASLCIVKCSVLCQRVVWFKDLKSTVEVLWFTLLFDPINQQKGSILIIISYL